MYLILLISLLLLIIQLILAIYAWNLKPKLKVRYKNILSSQLDPSTVLENNIKKFKNISIRVNNNLDDIAFSEKGFVMFKQKSLYKKDLYTNFMSLYYLYLSQDRYFRISKINYLPNLLFPIQFITLIFAIVSTFELVNPFIILTFVIQLFLILLSIINFFTINSFLNKVLKSSVKLLELDDLEEARCESLKNDLCYGVFEYPFEVIWRLVQFVKP